MIELRRPYCNRRMELSKKHDSLRENMRKVRMESMKITKSLSTAFRAIDSEFEDEGSGKKLILLRSPSPPEPPYHIIFNNIYNYISMLWIFCEDA